MPAKNVGMVLLQATTPALIAPETFAAFQQFLMLLILAGISILVPVGVAFLKAKRDEVLKLAEESFGPDVMDKIGMAADFAVKAAEQSGLSGQIAKEGAIKKAYAQQLAQGYLNANGWGGIDLGLLSAAIEKAVIENFPKTA